MKTARNIMSTVCLAAAMVVAAPAGAQPDVKGKVTADITYKSVTVVPVVLTHSAELHKAGAKPSRVDVFLVVSRKPILRGKRIIGTLDFVADSIDGMSNTLETQARKRALDSFGKNARVRTNSKSIDEDPEIREKLTDKGYRRKRRLNHDGDWVEIYTKLTYPAGSVVGKANATITLRGQPGIDANGVISLHMVVASSKVTGPQGPELEEYKKRINDETKEVLTQLNNRTWRLAGRHKDRILKGETSIQPDDKEGAVGVPFRWFGGKQRAVITVSAQVGSVDDNGAGADW